MRRWAPSSGLAGSAPLRALRPGRSIATASRSGVGFIKKSRAPGALHSPRRRPSSGSFQLPRGAHRRWFVPALAQVQPRPWRRRRWRPFGHARLVPGQVARTIERVWSSGGQAMARATTALAPTRPVPAGERDRWSRSSPNRRWHERSAPPGRVKCTRSTRSGALPASPAVAPPFGRRGASRGTTRTRQVRRADRRRASAPAAMTITAPATESASGAAPVAIQSRIAANTTDV